MAAQSDSRIRCTPRGYRACSASFDDTVALSGSPAGINRANGRAAEGSLDSGGRRQPSLPALAEILSSNTAADNGSPSSEAVGSGGVGRMDTGQGDERGDSVAGGWRDAVMQ